MQKTSFNNFKVLNEDQDRKKFNQFSKKEKRNIVDINILLNRVKLEKKMEIKRKIISFSLTSLLLSLFGIIVLYIPLKVDCTKIKIYHKLRIIKWLVREKIRCNQI